MKTLINILFILVFSFIGFDCVGTHKYVLSKQGGDTSRAPWNATYTYYLKKSLFARYDKVTRPSNEGRVSYINVDLYIHNFEFDDKTLIMILHGYLHFTWHDNNLSWNRSDYGGIEIISVADHEIWQPDIKQYNSASGSIDQFGTTHCVISFRGMVEWIPPATLKTFCKMDFKKWPQDEQFCNYTIGSWTYHGLEINIDSGLLGNTIPINDEFLVQNTEFELVDTKFFRKAELYDTIPYITITYTIHTKRRGNVRSAVLHSQIAVAAVLSLLAHCLPTSPVAAAPRAILAALPPAILAIALFYLGYRLPSTQYSPDIVTLYVDSLYLTLISGTTSILVLKVARERRTMPWLLKEFLNCKAAKLLTNPLPINFDSTSKEFLVNGSECDDDDEDEGNIISNPTTRPWLTLATLLDRLTLLLLVMAFILLFINL